MAYYKSFGFGSGWMFMTPASTSFPTPVRIGVMQNVSLDFTFDEKPLHGQNQFPEAVARGKAKCSCKCAFAQIDSKAIATVFLGGTPASGQEIIVDLQAQTGAATFQISTTAAFVSDLGVFYATTAQPLTQVTAGSETTGSYSVVQTSGSTNGRYTLSAGDSGAALLVSYKKTDTGNGFKTTIANAAMGAYVPFQTDLFQKNPEVTGGSSDQWGARLFKCASNKLSLATKQDDWIIPDMDFSIYANAAGNVMDFNTPN